MTREQAERIARTVWGCRAFVRECRSFMPTNNTTDAEGYVIPTGPVHGYQVGYSRKGKRGGTLSTVKGDGKTLAALTPSKETDDNG